MAVRVSLDIKFDPEPFLRALRELSSMADKAKPVMEAMGRAIRKLGDVIELAAIQWTGFARTLTIYRYGSGNETQAGEWQSDMCASWLHDSCRGGAFCVCRCHR